MFPKKMQPQCSILCVAKRIRVLCYLAIALLFSCGRAWGQSLPSGWSDSDIGSVGLSGSASYSNDVFTLNGAGTSLWGTADGFNFAYQSLSGDGTVVARILTAGSSTIGGVEVRDSLSANAMSAFLSYYSSAVYFNYRASTGGTTSQASSGGITLPCWLKMSRSGTSLSAYVSADGVTWVAVGSSQTISMGSNIYIGTGVTSGSTSTLATVTLDNVSINSASAPAPVITGVTPGAVGSQVVVSGSGFGAPQGSSVLRLNGTSISVDSWSATSIAVTIPTGATSGPMSVSVAPTMNDSNRILFTVASEPLTGWLDQDVGTVASAGSASFSSGAFSITATGVQVSGSADGMNFLFQPLSGDGTIVARVVSLTGGYQPAAGVMIRESLDAGSANAFTSASAGLVFFSDRSSTNGSTNLQTPVYS
jgi:hypothetical protein